ncbi:HPr kinase/phosphorylase [Stella sp.]|uniref:HPr kinase/phosphorylase n=1 Tax=Stella sp. TaxID=2912054 RepID=UPI0035B1F272
MTQAPDAAELLLHATTVAVAGVGVAITGPSGSGKSDLALRLIDGGARLVADDQTLVARRADLLTARAPPAIAGLLEVRGIGIVRLPSLAEAELRLIVAAVPPAEVERMPEPASRTLLGVVLPLLRLDPFAASAAAKLRLAVSNLA